VTPPETISFTRLAFAASLGAFVLIGATDAVFGPLLHPIASGFGVSLAVAGTVISVQFAGALTGVLGELAILRWAAHLPIATFALTVLVAGSLTIALARTWPVLLVGVYLAGAGFGGTDFSLNTLMSRTARRGRAARLNILNAAFGAGAVLGPAVAGWLGAATLTWGFGIAAAACCALAAGLSGVRPAPRGADPRDAGLLPAPAADQDAARGRSEDRPPDRTGNLARPENPARPNSPDRPGDPILPGSPGDPAHPDDPARPSRPGRRPGLGWQHGVVGAIALAYLLYVGTESGTAGWIPATLVGLHYSPRAATVVTSAFWGAMTVARLLVVPLSRVIPAPRIVLAAGALLTVALALTAIPAAAPAGYIVAGFAAGPIFPTGLDWIGTAFSGGRRATSWALLSSFGGGVAGPAAVAVVVSVAGLASVPAVLGAFAAATFGSFALIWIAGRRLA
jgi:FHS family glucose/mannose:H+ symporter-like MFS transporter